MRYHPWLKVGLTLFAVFFLFSCAPHHQPQLAKSTAKPLDGGNYTSKVDNFLVILDASSSMADRVNGIKKFDIAKQVASDMNVTLPGLGQNAGLRTLGLVGNKATAMLYGIKAYTTSDFAAGLDMVKKASGNTPLSKAVDASITDFKDLSGVHNALIVISDGLENDGSAAVAAQALKDQYGSSICIYTVHVGNDPRGAALLQEIADIGDCGFYTTADQLLAQSAMNDFVKNVFLEEKKVEKPAPAPAPAPAPEPEPEPEPAPAPAAPKDSDNDGVTDDKDQCPGTPAGATVNSIGCWALTNQVLFDYDKSNIKPEAHPFLEEVITILKANPNMAVVLQGHTDNKGSLKYNMGLSLRRANSVKEYLVNHGIAASRLETEGFAFKKPVALNGTAAGRALNRRVELHPK